MSDVLWISWEAHRRTSGICESLSIELAVLVSRHSSIRRYMQLARQTIGQLRSKRPRVLIVQNPSVVLTSLSVLLRPLFRYRLVVDAHNEAVEPYIHDNAIMRFVARRLMRAADLTIVTNEYLAHAVTAAGGRPAVLPDRLPASVDVRRAELAPDTFNAVLIATFADDEPVRPVVEAAARLDGRLTLYVTGNYQRLDAAYRESLPDNIVFTGYLEDDSYWGYLSAADAIVDLSEMDNCMVCGAYEGVASARPLLLTGNPACRQYFSKGVEFTDNSVDDIYRALVNLMERHAEYCDDILQLRSELPAIWEKHAGELMQYISRQPDTGHTS